MKSLFWLSIFCLLVSEGMAQRILPTKSKAEKKAEKQIKKETSSQSYTADTELRWDPRQLPAKSKGFPDISAWHNGTSGIIPSDAAEISLFNPSRIGFSNKTELLLRIAEEPFLPNIGLKHRWWGNRRFSLASEHTLYYTYPGLKLLQSTGFKGLISDTVKISQGFAMRHELLFSWLMNPQVWGCPNPAAEKILTLRCGSEFYIGFGDEKISPFDYGHALYHTQLLTGKVLYYGGLQFDSYFGHRFHYSINGLFYSIDLKKGYAAEGNLRLTYYLSRHWGISAACKAAYMNVEPVTKLCFVPVLDLTYLVNPGRTAIKHGLYKNKRKRR